MQILHLDLKEVAGEYVELRYFLDNPNQHQKRELPLTEIADLLNIAEQDFYFPLDFKSLRNQLSAEDYAKTGQKLYNWLDGSDRFFQRLLNQHQREGIVLAIATAENLAHLPWEVLHDGNSFLVQKIPGVVPLRWLSSDEVKKLTIEKTPENRALNLLFMATSPLGVEPILDFEAEEGRILEATAQARQHLNLIVEESGCLSELSYLIDNYGKGYFDVFHLTGHANLTDAGARFVTETEIGEAYYATAEDIARELQFQMPKLIFLSGCRTGQAGKVGAVPSMAEELLKLGGKAVLGWGQKVLDSEAKEAAATLYQELAAGKQVTEAVACTYQTLIKIKARDWHLLRLYAAESLPGNLVTPLRTRGRKLAPPASVATEFLDTAGKVKVATRQSFVGRRRQLQSCLRALTQSPEEVGVLIHGMGGLGKSSLAARLCDRLPDFERIVWVGRIDEPSLANRLAEKLVEFEELQKVVQKEDQELRFRLKRVFGYLEEEGKKPFLLVLDDFEDKNLASRDNGYVLKPETAKVLEALVWAIRETNSRYRLIITSRYDFDSTQLRYFYKQPLDALQGADLRKKCSRLDAFSGEVKVDEALQSQAKRLADGNPRLLEWLDKVLRNSEPHPLTPSPSTGRGEESVSSVVGQGQDLTTQTPSSLAGRGQGVGFINAAAILNRLEVDPVELREQVLAKALLELMDEPMQEMLSRGLVFELPVPKAALTAVCDSIPNLEGQINRAVALGLLEVSPDASLRVPRILPLNLPENGESLDGLAAEVLYRLWWEESKNRTEERCLEIHRLALRGKVENIAVEIATRLANRWKNKSRFREAVHLCQSTLEITEDYRILHQLARSEEFLGDINRAFEHFHQSLDLCPPENEGEKAIILHNLASLYAANGQLDKAITHHQEALNISTRLNDSIGITKAFHAMTYILIMQGKHEEAENLNQQTLKLRENIGDEQGQASTLANVAFFKFKQGRIEEALALYQEILKIDEQFGNIHGTANTLLCLAAIETYQGKIDEGIILYHKSQELSEQIGDISNNLFSLLQLARLYTQLGKIEEVDKLCQRYIDLTKNISDVKVKAISLHNIAEIYSEVGQFEEALILYQQSLNLAESCNDIHTKATTLHKIAVIYTQQTRIEEAIILFKQSLEIKENINDIEGKGVTLSWLGGLAADVLEDFDQALDYLQQSLDIAQCVQSPEVENLRAMIARVQQLADNK